MKKTLALVLALAMVFSTITVAFAEGTIGADAQITADLGMLKGSTGTVDAAYTATAPTRIQAAVMFLRLKGLEAEAKAFTGAANFADADKAAWAKPIMAYLKANPQLGWQGDGTNFSPDKVISAKEYYKVLLESLGYKQNTAEVVGDFAYADVLAFAAGKGLTKVAAVTNFTVNDLATATVEALKLNVKDGGKTLIASLVDAGKVDAAKATAAGIYTKEVVATADLKAVKAVANNKLEVEFAAEIGKAFAENAASYKVVEKGTTTAVEVKGAVAQSGTIAVIEVAALTAGKSYTLVIGAVSKNFTGIAKDAAAPKVSSVAAVDTNTLEVTFDKVMDAESATSIANYTLNNSASVKAAALDSDRKVVTLTTEGVANGKLYTLKVENVKSSDLVAIKSVSKNFTGKSDTTAPKLNGSVKAVNANLLEVTFTDAHGLNKSVAETLANWSINNDLAIEKVTAIGNDNDDYYYKVQIVTATQVAGKSYTLTMSNLVDGSVSANKISKDITKEFKGAYADTSAPTVSTTPTVDTNTSIQIVFSDKNALDVASATDANNYEITYKDGATTNTLAVVGAKIKDTDDLYHVDGRTVILTTDSMDDKFIYTLVIKDVADEFGNAIEPVSGTTYKKYTFRGKDEDIIPPYVASVNAVDSKTVKVVFDDKVDKASATDPTNYSFNNDLGVAVKASLSSTSTTVTLTTPEQVVGKSYTITINGVKDLTGNEASAVKVSFIAARTSNDTTAPEVAYIEATYKDEVLVHFTEAVKDGNAILMTTANGTTFNQVGKLLDDETTAVLKPEIVPPATGLTDTKYTVSALSNVVDKTGNAYVPPTPAHEFWGTIETNQGPEVSSWEQLNPTTIRVVFTEPVSFTANVNGTGDVATGFVNSDNMAGYTWDAFIDKAGDADNNGYSTVDLVADNVLKIAEDADPIEFNFTTLVTDYVGTAAVDADDTAANTALTSKFTTYIQDEDKPEIVNVEAVNEYKIVVTMNEDVKSTVVGSYKISYDDNGTTKYVAISSVDRDSSTYSKINIATTTELKSEFVYTLVPLTGAQDLSGNTLAVKDISFDFTGTDIQVADYVKGVVVIDADTINVTSSKVVGAVNAVYELTSTGAEIAVNLNSTNNANGTNKVVVIDLARPILAGTTYVAYIDNMPYKFSGIVDDAGIRVIATSGLITFSGMDVETPFTQTVVANVGGVNYTTVVGGTGFTIGAPVGNPSGAAPTLEAGTTVYVSVSRSSDSVVLYGAKVTAETVTP
ncbi:MAG: Ig-like domain-containing protein [Clostridia bacterium]